MPKKSTPAPEYKKHPNGQAFVYHASIDRPGHVLYLGKYGSPKSLQRYQAFLKRLESQQAAAPDSSPAISIYRGCTLAELVARYLQHCEVYYRHADGSQTSEFACMKEALAPLVALFGEAPAEEFTVADLETYRNYLIARGQARTTINARANRVRRMFQKAVVWGAVAPAVWQSLLAVESLKAGRTKAKEPKPIPAADWSIVSLVLPHLSPVVAAMVQVQFWSGMRPQDVTGLRQCDIDTSGEIWIHKPPRHKNTWRGQSLIKAIPVRVQPLLAARFTDDPEAYLFSPREAVAWRAAEQARTATRTTREYPCERRAKERRKSVRAARGPQHRERYSTNSYRQAIEYGIAKLNTEREESELPPIAAWTPNQLRHGIATFLDRTIGPVGSQRYLGHKHLSTTGVYIEVSAEELVAIARKIDRLAV